MLCVQLNDKDIKLNKLIKKLYDIGPSCGIELGFEKLMKTRCS